ncbi:hypothetical protein E4T50_01807 [Aureobasidium sp. EXF-12298]|nr:hypothetical protein E4T50_01807 [Aureobasidium sp. EXF-12298]KAI4760440.1 hypothetical protein E4T51_06541 [Aureobasidium sp. EXF-12344]KAI4784086.1 hypothetical protein E4T52_00972 [Aureobasidium sp. EXF-3400]
MSAQLVTHNKTVVLSTYRNLLRATRIAFQGIRPLPPTPAFDPRDDSTLYNSRRFARDSFDQNRGIKAGSIEAEKAVEHAQGVAQILRENVVQGATDKEESETYKLRIHDHTEKGDNESVKQFKGTTKSFAEVKRCSLI